MASLQQQQKKQPQQQQVLPLQPLSESTIQMIQNLGPLLQAQMMLYFVFSETGFS